VIERLADGSGLALGIFPTSYEERSVRLAAGDALVLYTDGVTEAFNTDGAMFDEPRLIECIRAAAHPVRAAALVDAIVDDVAHFAGAAPQSDDITVAVLVWTPSS
jgi:phosphoserine phosphatase RsbU/P